MGSEPDSLSIRRTSLLTDLVNRIEMWSRYWRDVISLIASFSDRTNRSNREKYFTNERRANFVYFEESSSLRRQCQRIVQRSKPLSRTRRLIEQMSRIEDEERKAEDRSRTSLLLLLLIVSIDIVEGRRRRSKIDGDRMCMEHFFSISV